MGQSAAYRIRENGQDTYAYSHWSGVISPFSRMERALEWLEKNPDMSVTDILLRLCDGEKLHDPSSDSINSPYMSNEAGMSRYFNLPPQEWGDIEMLVELDIDSDEVSFRFDPHNYNHLMDTTLSISDGIRIMGEVYEEQKDKVDEPDNIWHYEIAFTERTITPCTITIEEMRERMKSGDVDFIKQHIRRFDRTDHWGGYSKDFDSLFTQACQMPKGDNQMLEAVTEVYRRHYYSGHSDYNAVKDAVIHTMNTNDFERFKMIFDNLPDQKYRSDYTGDYKERIVTESMNHGNDAYALYGLKSGMDSEAFPWFLTESVKNRCVDCRDFLITTGIDYKDKEHKDNTVALLFQAAKQNDVVMLDELKRQGVSMNYDRSRVFFICKYQENTAAAAVLVEHGGDLNKFKNAYAQSNSSKLDNGAEFFRTVENGGSPEAAEQGEDEEFEQ